MRILRASSILSAVNRFPLVYLQKDVGIAVDVTRVHLEETFPSEMAPIMQRPAEELIVAFVGHYVFAYTADSLLVIEGWEWESEEWLESPPLPLAHADLDQSELFSQYLLSSVQCWRVFEGGNWLR